MSHFIMQEDARTDLTNKCVTKLYLKLDFKC